MIHLLPLRESARSPRHSEIKTAHSPPSEHCQPSQGDEIIHEDTEDTTPFGGVQQARVTTCRKRKGSCTCGRTTGRLGCSQLVDPLGPAFALESRGIVTVGGGSVILLTRVSMAGRRGADGAGREPWLVSGCPTKLSVPSFFLSHPCFQAVRTSPLLFRRTSHSVKPRGLEWQDDQARLRFRRTQQQP